MYEIKSEIVKDEIIVNAKFKEGKVIVHEINTAFPLDTTEEVIRSAVEKAETLFYTEREQQIKQKKIDDKYRNAKKVVNKLNFK